VKSHGREIASRVFTRKSDALAWEQEQTRKLRRGEWIDPKRGHVPLSAVATEWLESRKSKKRRTYEADRADWRLHVGPRFAHMPVASITSAEVSSWVGGLVAKGRSASSATRYLNTLRSILKYAVADGRVSVNAAAGVEAPSGGQARREGQFLTVRQLKTWPPTAMVRTASWCWSSVWAACGGVSWPVGKWALDPCARPWIAASASCPLERRGWRAVRGHAQEQARQNRPAR
jgi:hypothetical protein